MYFVTCGKLIPFIPELRISLAGRTHEFTTNAEDPKRAMKAVIQTYPTIR